MSNSDYAHFTRGSKLKEIGFLIEVTGNMRLPMGFDFNFLALHCHTVVSNSQVLLSTSYEPDTFLVLFLLLTTTLYIVIHISEETGSSVVGHMARGS